MSNLSPPIEKNIITDDITEIAKRLVAKQPNQEPSEKFLISRKDKKEGVINRMRFSIMFS